MANYYDILGVSKEASEAEIRKTYHHLARKYHPDVNDNDEASEERFKEINEAYQVLSDPEKRRKYDRYGDDWKSADRMEEAQATPRGSSFSWHFAQEGSSVFGGASVGDIFDEFLSGSGRTLFRSATEVPVQITLEEAYKGATRRMEAPSGFGSGVRRRLEVKIPPGVDTGSRVRIPYGDGRQQDLYLRISVLPHPRFQREGNDLQTEVEVPLVDAVLGGEVAVTTLKGQVALKVPPETQNGRVFRLTGQGMPHLDNPQVYGDFLAKVKVLLPKDLSQEERQLFQQLKGLRVVRR